MQRVGIVVDGFSGGGAELCAADIASGLAQQGHAVDLVVLRDLNHFVPSLPPGVRVIPLRKARAAASFWALVQYIRRERPTALLGNGDVVNVLLVGARAFAPARSRLVLRQHSPLFWTLNPHEGIKTRLIPCLDRALYKRAEAVVAISSGVARELQMLLGLQASHIRVIRPGVISPRLYRLAQEPIDLQSFFPSPDRQARVIVSAGHLIAPKGYDTLLWALRQVRRAIDVRLLILGEGPQRGWLTALSEELGLRGSVAMPGWVANPYPAFRAADLVVVASWWEASSRVLIEALALGTPVVSTDCDFGPRETLQGGRLGRLVPVRDSTAMARAILDALSEPRRPPPMADLWEYTEEEVVRRYAEVLAL